MIPQQQQSTGPRPSTCGRCSGAMISKSVKRKCLSLTEDEKPSVAVKKRKCVTDNNVVQQEGKILPDTGQVKKGQKNSAKKRSLSLTSDKCSMRMKRRKGGGEQRVSLVRRGPAVAQACASGHDKPETSKSRKRPASDTESSTRKAKKQKLRPFNGRRKMASAPDGVRGPAHTMAPRQGFGDPADRRQTWEVKMQEDRNAMRGLQERGVRLLGEREMQAMSQGREDLGAGAYGSCCKARDPESGDELVIKTFPKDKLQALVREAATLQALQVPGVQRLVGVCVRSRQLVSHYAGVTAESYFRTAPAPRDSLSVIVQVARTLQRTLGKGFAHNDMKGNNVCVRVGGGGPVATVIDFGIAKRVGARGFFSRNTDPSRFPWLAPELLRGTHPCGEASDVYSLGYLIRGALLGRGGFLHHQSMSCVVTWVRGALSPEPDARPTLALLIDMVEALLESTAAPPRSSGEATGGGQHEGRTRGWAADTSYPGGADADEEKSDESSAWDGTTDGSDEGEESSEQ